MDGSNGTTPTGTPQHPATATEQDAPATEQDAPATAQAAPATPLPAPAWAAPDATGRQDEIALRIRGLRKRFGDKEAVAGIDLDVPAGSFFGLVGPNGAGKTTTLSMATALLRPDAGTVTIHDVDVWWDTLEAKRLIGVLADGVKLFDRLTGLQLITYYGLLCGIDRPTVLERAGDLLDLLGLDPADRTLVVDYSAGMTKKIALACALVRAPRLLVLDEPFESVDPVSAANIRDILTGYVASGGTVIVSSHSMDLVERMCDRVAVIADGRVLAAGTLEEVRAGSSLEERFVDLVGGRTHQEGPAWLRIS
ncbi:ABC transporter ATP-binding protein [Rathayibacter sp. VKM Ac-2760]|uniref:ABC transporter ATP-binding protein n=1 Tax=Rathayibacter sp. VKM Ac-2760 TaxID=2609253 RepID=UPI0013198086|nr:ABC transporter ATP-binding protein [Rathayibacter sp. VKM Ac-2760]QHC57629.1 ATP-binding cassette domain-containing protein [Rathayibacter sp. VKM Ac-2760]